mgnify:CR=1 FL=1
MIIERMTALALPDETQFRHDIEAINRFQRIVHSSLVRNLDYGVIPGTQKPTLLKPGAEKIAKLLGLADQCEIVDRQEIWDKPFFRYLVRAKLIHLATGVVVSEGLGECNSMESKYRWRWISERDLPSDIDKSKLVSQGRHSKSGGKWTVYRLDNEDIYSQVNTILKMAKKRALVDAALSAGRLSDVFTQDMEDMPETTVASVIKSPPEDLEDSKPHPDTKLSSPAPEGQGIESAGVKDSASPIDLIWLDESMKAIKWPEKTILSWLRSKANFTGLDLTGTLPEIIARMNHEQASFLVKEIQDRLSMK